MTRSNVFEATSSQEKTSPSSVSRKWSPRPVTSKMAWKPNRPSLTTTWKSHRTRQHSLRLNPPGLNSFGDRGDPILPVLRLVLPVLPVVSGATRHLTTIAGTAQQLTLPVMVAAKKDTGSKYANRPQPDWCPTRRLNNTPDVAYVIEHEAYQVQPNSKGLFVNLALSFTGTSSPQTLQFQVDSGCSCNTMHITDLEKIQGVKIQPSPVRLLDYSKTVIPTKGQATLHCSHRDKSLQIEVQIITLLSLAWLTALALASSIMT